MNSRELWFWKSFGNVQKNGTCITGRLAYQPMCKSLKQNKQIVFQNLVTKRSLSVAWCDLASIQGRLKYGLESRLGATIRVVVVW